MSDWRHKAACDGEPLATFFEDIWHENEDGETVVFDLVALARARSICDRCPVRRQCYAAAMEEEGNAAPGLRQGFRAGLTGAQRWSANHRKAVTCPVCGFALDPNAVREGEIACVNECAIDRTMPAIPEAGDQWTRRHTTLARKVVRWLVEDVEVGDQIPRPTDLAKQWKERRTDMCRVFDALSADGTLAFDGKSYSRNRRIGLVREWNPAHLVLVESLVA